MKTMNECEVGDVLVYDNRPAIRYLITDKVIFDLRTVFIVESTNNPSTKFLVFDDGSWMSCVSLNRRDDTKFAPEQPKKVTDANVGDIVWNVSSPCVVEYKFVRDNETYLIVKYQNEYTFGALYVVDKDGNYDHISTLNLIHPGTFRYAK